MALTHRPEFESRCYLILVCDFAFSVHMNLEGFACIWIVDIWSFQLPYLHVMSQTGCKSYFLFLPYVVPFFICKEKREQWWVRLYSCFFPECFWSVYLGFVCFFNSLRLPEKSINMVTQSSEPNSLLDSYMILYFFRGTLLSCFQFVTLYLFQSAAVSVKLEMLYDWTLPSWKLCCKSSAVSLELEGQQNLSNGPKIHE